MLSDLYHPQYAFNVDLTTCTTILDDHKYYYWKYIVENLQHFNKNEIIYVFNLGA